jgi:radical SAM protein with 4Fe4S-binding SPASM domain
MKMGACNTPVNGFEFDAAEIAEAVENGRLLSIEIEFSRKCNFRCPYCYVEQDDGNADELSPDEFRGVILQARALGARKIVVLGGEPMLYPHIAEMTMFMRKHSMDVEMFTNGTNMTPQMARFLMAHRVRVVMKMNTRDERLQDLLSGREGANQIIRAALKNLRSAGYPGEERLLGVSSVICRDNYDELIDLWQWLRDQNIEPYFEMITPQGNAARNEWLHIDGRRVEQIFRTISALDRACYGRVWEPQPPLVGARCLRHQFSCLVTSRGDVMPCVGVTITVGNVRERSLGDIIANSKVIQELRDYRRTIKGPCLTCDKANECYGCRGAAYQLTGDHLASDPLCWRNRDLISISEGTATRWTH